MTGLTVHWEQIGEILALLFVISLVFETALTPIFNWRFFAKHFEGKGVKTPLTIAAAVALLWSYDIDIFKHIIDAFAHDDAKTSSNFVGRVMTGLLVAGGSGAIFNIFTKMKLRDPDKLAEKAAQARGQPAPAQPAAAAAPAAAGAPAAPAGQPAKPAQPGGGAPTASG